MLKAFANKMEVGNGVFNPNNLNPYSYGYNNPVLFDDPDGRCPWCIVVGGLLGAGLELGGQLLSGKSLNQVDWADVAIEGVKGAVLGSGIGASYVAGVEAAATGLKASVDYSNEEGMKVVTNGSKSITSAAYDGFADAVAGKIGSAGSKGLNKIADNLVSTAGKAETKAAKSLTKANNVFNKVTDGGKNMIGSKSVAAASNLANSQSKMLQSKGDSAAAKMLQTSVKSGTVINNAIQNNASDRVKKTFGL